MIGGRRYMRHRRAYTPRCAPPVVLAVVLAELAIHVLGTGVLASVAICVVCGFGVVQVRWATWRWRHPIISHDQYVSDLRRAAPWN
jgi:hypothetical protein